MKSAGPELKASGKSAPRTAENLEDVPGRLGGGQSLTHPTVIEEFRNGGERPEMDLELVLGDDEQDDKAHRHMVQRPELDALF